MTDDKLQQTPRTDAEQARVPVSDPTGLVPWVALSFARTLERELDALQQVLEKAGRGK